MQRVYKIVRVNPDEPRVFWSAMLHGPVVDYRIGEWTKAPVGGLLVFGTLEGANAWRNGSSQKVFLASASLPVEMPEYAASFIFHENGKDIRYLKSLWKGNPEKLMEHDYLMPWPPGTLAFKRVRLIEEVTP